MMRLLITLVLLTSLSACFSEHRVRVDQGVLIDQDSLTNLQAGLSKDQVRALFGPPILSSFNDQRWSYVFHSSDPNFQADKVKQLVVEFDAQGYVSQWATPTQNKDTN